MWVFAFFSSETFRIVSLPVKSGCFRMTGLGQGLFIVLGTRGPFPLETHACNFRNFFLYHFLLFSLFLLDVQLMRYWDSSIGSLSGSLLFFIYLFVLLSKRFPQPYLLTFYWILNHGCYTFNFQELYLVLWLITLLEHPLPVFTDAILLQLSEDFTFNSSFCFLWCFLLCYTLLFHQIPVVFFSLVSYWQRPPNVWQWLAIRSRTDDVPKVWWVTSSTQVGLTGPLHWKEIR